MPPKELWVCPDCLQRAPIHDHRERVWRPLDTFQYRTLLHARVPRLNCPTRGIKQIHVPWAEDNSRFTALFKGFALDEPQWVINARAKTRASASDGRASSLSRAEHSRDYVSIGEGEHVTRWRAITQASGGLRRGFLPIEVKEASISAVAERLHLSWDEAAGIPATRGPSGPGSAHGMARGFRSPQRFRMAIYFHCGGLVAQELSSKRMRFTGRIPEVSTHTQPVPCSANEISHTFPGRPRKGCPFEGSPLGEAKCECREPVEALCASMRGEFET